MTLSATTAQAQGADELRGLIAALPSPEPHDDPIVVEVIPTPVGPMIGGATSAGVCLLEFSRRLALPAELAELPRLLDRPVVPASTGIPSPLHHLKAELAAYFAGQLRRFTVPLITPGTPFEQEVWTALQEIPFGATCSYGQLAGRLGRPGAQRAVGRANGRNRIAIVIPCHRVIESTGALRGYGGGLDRKRFLLDHERELSASTPTLFDQT
jgi:AraC family transcriptional regulator of adaptative response/methylated-DNA-[protein]-cysteine methyltransferase